MWSFSLWVLYMKRTLSLNKNKDFTKIYKKGKFSSGKYLTIYLQHSKKDINRIGITAARKVGKSVKRNRLRRLVKENYRLFEDYIFLGNDFIFMIRQNDILPSFWDIKKEMKYHLRKLSVFDNEKWNSQKNY
jgi:ribonuclease P protein component